MSLQKRPLVGNSFCRPTKLAAQKLLHFIERLRARMTVCAQPRAAQDNIAHALHHFGARRKQCFRVRNVAPREAAPEPWLRLGERKYLRRPRSEVAQQRLDRPGWQPTRAR